MSAFNVAKFGGTSVANFEAMSRCATIIENNPNTRLVVSSACSGVTNLLVELANGVQDQTHRTELLQNLANIHDAILTQLEDSTKTAAEVYGILDTVTSLAEAASIQASAKLTDHLVACGELMSTHILTQLMCERGIQAVRFDIRDVLRTDDNFGRAEPNIEAISTLAQDKLVPLCQQSVVVTQGFIGSDEAGNTTTLGRGGSDYSAALIAESVKAAGLEIWTDVPGIYTTDPRIAPKASPIPEISFSEASEMANFGAKILHPSTLVPALRHDIPVFVGSSKEPEKGGTWIRHQVESSPLFRALALRCNQTMVTLRSANMFHAYGFLAKVFEILAKHKISVDLITTSEISVSLTLDQTDTSGGAPQLPQAAREELEELCKVEVEHDLCLVALIGNNMSESKGYAKQVFGTLEDFNLRMICYGASPHNLCFLLHESVSKQAIQKLHTELFEK
ncbi:MULTISPECIES: lysine-sensitive aspartokinase 3 [Vibrio]|uniref:Aspartokinase n=3 Tax=Vibrio harveyi group TaxID=717610 RepID=A0A0H0Y8C9_VIBAL|nr:MULTISPECIES: lysine-sensitive aspartokinase 3 [Vibrio]MDG2627337.1 lysine-sensitive aspartokinase 3 [Vibrio parahaemolyticus]MDK9730972.1 lysine-sensitive aspartokinase 3 [Vibrio sp. D415a]MDK9740732.1 lysine-sensitive aspartokinase 3 [Vibrio sp. B516a]MDK9749332.1 lysine-sensitive aspartokinase 3 [Vibrio sp. D409a]MDK9769684.1 lysine-sensitive aspartokinase 3 [Vibrio sp. D417a]MDK9789619.1 lysine-sensitive aspartokinase 3 [Vibrio sp. D421a]MDK9794537.1 lysine-sensitive aspartokinase 3 [